MFGVHSPVLDWILFLWFRARRSSQLLPFLLENDDLRHSMIPATDLEGARPGAGHIACHRHDSRQQNNSHHSFHSAPVSVRLPVDAMFLRRHHKSKPLITCTGTTTLVSHIRILVGTPKISPVWIDSFVAKILSPTDNSLDRVEEITVPLYWSISIRLRPPVTLSGGYSRLTL